MDNGLYQSNAAQTSYENPACEVDVRNFRTCMDENQGNLGICGWYLDQLVCRRFFCLYLYLSHTNIPRRKLARLPLSLTKGFIPL